MNTNNTTQQNDLYIIISFINGKAEKHSAKGIDLNDFMSKVTDDKSYISIGGTVYFKNAIQFVKVSY